MTLGPDRKTVARWLAIREQMLEEADKGGGGGAGESDKGGDSDKGGAKGTPVTVEIEGKHYVLQTRVDELVGGARTEGHTKGKTDAAEEAKQAALKEQGDYRKLYEAETEKREAAERERDNEKLGRIRDRIGSEFKLPARLWSRLEGATEAEIRKDAEETAKDLGLDKAEDGGKDDSKKDDKKDDKGGEKKTQRKAPDTESGNGGKVRQRDDKTGKDEEGKPKRSFAFQKPGDVSW